MVDMMGFGLTHLKEPNTFTIYHLPNGSTV